MFLPPDVYNSLTHVTDVLLRHGALALFILLAVGIVGLPIPEETLLITAGVLLAKGKLSIPMIIVAALCGSMCGITVSYGIGRGAGSFLIKKYGRWIGITEQRAQRVHEWFEHFGVWLLFFGYFILGVRHLTGYVAGVVELEYRKFALFAYMGAIFWVSTFLSLGYILAHHKMLHTFIQYFN